jgi:hypothetical protein
MDQPCLPGVYLPSTWIRLPARSTLQQFLRFEGHRIVPPAGPCWPQRQNRNRHISVIEQLVLENMKYVVCFVVLTAIAAPIARSEPAY